VGGGPACWSSGEAGIGKTSLLQEFADEVLAAPGAAVPPSVHHAVAAADEQAVANNAAAAARDAAASSAHREAAAFARLALQHEAMFDRLEVARLHGLASQALYARNQFGEAAEHADRAVELWDAAGSAPQELGEALLVSARMSTLRADPDTGRAKALRALGILEAFGPSRALARCYSTLCSQDALQGGGCSSGPRTREPTWSTRWPSSAGSWPGAATPRRPG
jgi:hypothetical protein